METAWIVLKQTGIMALYMMAGFALFRKGWITKEGSKTLANVLIRLIIPCSILNGFCVAHTEETLARFFLIALLTAGALLVAMFLSWLVYRKKPMDQFAAAFPNCGFIGIPLVRAVLGEEYVLYAVPFVALLNVLQFLYSNRLFADAKTRRPVKELLLHPILIGTGIGLVLFLLNGSAVVPPFLSEAVRGIAWMNSPVAMIVLGVYLAQTDLKKLFLTPRLYALSAVRLLLIPIVTAALLLLTGVDHISKTVILLCGSASIGANIAVYAQLYDADYAYACQAVALSTVLSIVTMPLLTLLTGLLPGF